MRAGDAAASEEEAADCMLYTTAEAAEVAIFYGRIEHPISDKSENTSFCDEKRTNSRSVSI